DPSSGSLRKMSLVQGDAGWEIERLLIYWQISLVRVTSAEVRERFQQTIFRSFLMFFPTRGLKRTGPFL
ncbi:MAG: hypothetical protein ACREYC_23325, partial [Gammaproteobacteria bacterium]